MQTANRQLAWDYNLPLVDENVPQGDPEYTRDLAHERQLGLHIIGTFGISLGLLAMRCERRGSLVFPLTIAIAETPLVIEPAQSNPRRVWSADDDEAFT